MLRHADNTDITEGEAKRMGAFGFFVHESPLRFNASSVEAKVQQRSHHHGLGRRLVRFPDMGAGGLDLDETVPGANGKMKLNPNYRSKVFFTCLPVQQQRIIGGVITHIRVGGKWLLICT